MRKLGLYMFLLLGAPAVSMAQGQQKLTIETLWKLDRVGDPQLSPDGETVLYTVGKADIAANKTLRSIYSRPSVAAAASAADKLIASPEDGAMNPRWRPDGKKIGYLSAKSGSMQMWEMNPDGSGKKQVTNIPGGIAFFLYSPSGNHIAYATDVMLDKRDEKLFEGLDKVSGKVIDGLNFRHWDTWHDGSYTHVFVASYKDGQTITEGKDLLAGQPYDAPVKPFGGEEQISWSPDGTTLAYTSKKVTGTQYAVSTNSDIFLYNINTGAEQNVTAANLGYDNDPAFSPDGKYLAYLSMERAGYESDKNRIMLLDLKTNERKEATAALDQTTDQISWSPDSKQIFFVSQIQATKQIYVYTLKPAKRDMPIRQITQGWHDYTGIQVAMKGKKPVLVGSKMTISSPVQLFVVDAASGKEEALTTVNKDLLSQIKMGKVERRMVKSTDGKEILTWVVLPPDFDPNKKYPTLLYCQGGPQSAVSSFFSTRWNFQLMAANGYVVVAPNRRGLQSFGQAWNDAIIGDYGGQPMTDLMTAIDDVSRESYVNKDKIGAVGASFGGYTVYWLAGHNNDHKFKTFIAHCGMYNMESWYGSTEEMFFANNDQKGPYWENQQNYEKFSPHNFVKNWNAPMLVIHNEKDFRVPITQGMEAFTAAQIKGLKSRFLYFPDENHWVSKPQNSVLWQRVFFDWLDKTLK